jgi:hypothetical protein
MNTGHPIQQKIADFLSGIGIAVIEKPLPGDTFLPGLALLGSTILMDTRQLKHPGDLLHEAGHIATTEAARRPLIGSGQMGDDWPTPGDEIATILWTYAAAHHLGLDLEVVFHPDGYKGQSAWLIEQFSNGNYIGLPLLAWMGLCEEQAFPDMRRWLRE